MSKTRYPESGEFVYIRNSESKKGEITHRGRIITTKMGGAYHGRIEIMIEMAKIKGKWHRVSGKTNQAIPVDDFTYLKEKVYVIEAPESVLHGLIAE
jgi:hypothetical protein